jgi:hypothetical protein
MEDFYDGVPSSKSSYPCPDLPGDRARHGHPRPGSIAGRVRLAAAGVQRVGPL